MKTRRELAEEQLELMELIRSKSNINMVTCGNCGTLLLHERDAEEIDCFGCKTKMDVCDCPDYWYSGCIDNEQFND